MQQINQNTFGINPSSHNPINSLLMSSAGISSSAGSGLSSTGAGMNTGSGLSATNSLLSQLKNLANSAPPAAEASTENISAFAGAQRLLGFGNSSQRANTSNVLTPGLGIGGRGLYNQAPGAPASNVESGGVSDALSLLARAIPRGDGGSSSHDFGGIPDKKD
jgi:hypothetical protein